MIAHLRQAKNVIIIVSCLSLFLTTGVKVYSTYCPANPVKAVCINHCTFDPPSFTCSGGCVYTKQMDPNPEFKDNFYPANPSDEYTCNKQWLEPKSPKDTPLWRCSANPEGITRDCREDLSAPTVDCGNITFCNCTPGLTPTSAKCEKKEWTGYWDKDKGLYETQNHPNCNPDQKE